MEKHLLQYAPMIVFGLAGLGVVYFLLVYRRKNDLRVWLHNLRQMAERAGGDEAFRKEKLAEIESELAKLPVPETIVPVKRKHEASLQTLPTFMFVVGACGVFLFFMGIFRPHPEGRGNWEIYAGPICLAVVALAYAYLERIRPNYSRVQRMNCKYLLQKAGDDPAALDTLTGILEYYPGVPQLWMEKADALASGGRIDEAVEAIKRAVALAPRDLDLSVVEVSFHLRKGSLDDAEKALENVWNLKKVPTDPRPDIYAAAIALRRDDTEKAFEHGERAVGLDRDFLQRFFPRDEGLRDIEKFLRARKAFSSDRK